MPDLVNHPPHYTSHPSGVECIQITEHMGFNLGNAVKYIWRADEKGAALDDLRKAAWYVQREIGRRTVAQMAPDQRAASAEASPDQQATYKRLFGSAASDNLPAQPLPREPNPHQPGCLIVHSSRFSECVTQ